MSQGYLPRLEIRMYILCHATFILYAIWNVFSFRKEIYAAREDESTFAKGWFGFQKEVGDSEWEYFKSYIVVSLPWMVSHTLLSFLLKIFGFGRLLPWGYAIVGFGFITVENGFLPTLCLLLHVIPYFLLPRRWGGRGVFLLAVLSLLIANLSKCDLVYFWLIDNTRMTHTQFFQMIVVDGWTTLKCISFALDRQEKEANDDQFTFSHFLGYVFYFPTLYLGPPIVYSRFRACYRKEMPKRGFAVLGTFLWDLLSVLFWSFILELSHHGLYLATLQYSLELLQTFNFHALFGYGYLLGQHFHVKYVVLYGFSCAFAKLDGIETPPRPICVARVHRYSDMWKHFDRGLYEFLVKYIYTRFQSKSSGNGRKILAMFITFTFIYVWHGYFLAILAWSALNSIGILLEQATRAVQRSPTYHNCITRRFSTNAVYRIEGVLGTHLLILAVISNFFFLANYEVGVLFLKRTYFEGVLNYLCITSSLLFIYYTAEYCKRRCNRT